MAESRPLFTLFKILKEQGLLKGDINWGQRMGLHWLMIKDQDDILSLEKIRMKATALSGNPLTSESFIKTLFDEEKPETEEEKVQENVNWVTPQSEEELAELEQLLLGK